MKRTDDFSNEPSRFQKIRFVERNEMTTPSQATPAVDVSLCIEHDADYNRYYIPMPGGWEIQTKGKGSSFRLCNTKNGRRLNIPPSPYLYEWLGQMAQESNAAYHALLDRAEKAERQLDEQAGLALELEHDNTRLRRALDKAMEWNWLDDDARPSEIADFCDAALKGIDAGSETTTGSDTPSEGV